MKYETNLIATFMHMLQYQQCRLTTDVYISYNVA